MPVTRYEAVAVVHLYHVSVTAFVSGFRDNTGRRSRDDLSALPVDVHTGVKLVCPPAEWTAPESEFVIYLALMRPDRRDRCRIAGRLNNAKPVFDLEILSVHILIGEWSTAVRGEIVERVGP